MSERIVLHEDPISGNCYKIRLTAALLNIPIERRAYDITKGETRTADFLAKVNANGRIPVLQVGDRFLPESNAACHYLADGSHLVPGDRFDRADMLRWMFFEQYNHEPNIATLRFWLSVVGEENLTATQRAQIDGKRHGGNAALDLMERQLAGQGWLLSTGPSLADIVLYSYTHVAHEAGFDLSDRPSVAAWLDRVAALPGFVPMNG